ncbi:TadE/TadG family type IV pilus assembly protein [Candidatus Leptofilum sp.]|uniref:TadE/TadG family type IV pilus assembly protein n=1 Tax=Candidatus Leptofilum sp. TaxID=3241576 RepID=UPI003B5A1C22
MTDFRKRFNDSPGQALVEFALIITVLLMMIFLIIESARILWAWNTVQNAAREGARYAITGQSEILPCPVDFGLPKFVSGDRNVCTDQRLASIIARAHTALSGLTLNEESATFEEDHYYNIEIWGKDETDTDLRYDFAGGPNNPVVVRVTYRVPIITPFFQPILPSIPVFGQEILYNETFGQLGGHGNEGAALPSNLPVVPTPGVTPSPEPTDTPGPTSTNTPSPSPPPPPRCDLRFEGTAVAGNNFVFVTGEVGIEVEIINLTTGATLGSDTLDGPFNDHACPGFRAIVLNPALDADDVGNVLLAAEIGVSDNNDTTFVLGQPPTPTSSPTTTPIPTSTATSPPPPTATNTPAGPFIAIAPNCGPGPNIQFTIQGFNWPVNRDISLYWEGDLQQEIQQHTGTITYAWSIDGLTDGTYTVLAEASGNGPTSSATFTIPCPGQPTSTPNVATATPAPVDLVAIGPPALISTPPLVAYQPVQFSVAITNTGEVAVENQFFVDIYLDPTSILTDRIPLSESDGYSAVSGLGGGESQTVIVNAPFGFANNPTNHQVYGMVDSVLQIPENIETNNVTDPLTVNNVTPAATPTPTPDLVGDSELSGLVRALVGTYLPQFRAEVFLTDESSSLIVAKTATDENGYYVFDTVPPGTYTVHACILIDNVQYFGLRTGRTPPNPYVDIYAAQGVCP